MIKTMKKGFTLIELMIVVAIIGILAAIAIPNFIKFQARSKQAEVKANMKAIFTAEKSYFQEKDTYSNFIGLVGFSPERGNRYSYDIGSSSSGGSGAAAAYQARTATLPGTDCSPTPCLVGIQADTFQYTNAGIGPSMQMAVTAAADPGNTGNFMAGAAGNIDADTVYDQWSVSSVSRTSGASSGAACTEGNNPEGEPCNDLNDVNVGS